MKKKLTVSVLYALSALFLLGGILMLIRQYVLLPGSYTPPTLTPAPTFGSARCVRRTCPYPLADALCKGCPRAHLLHRCGGHGGYPSRGHH